ncbi:hypothetical protein FACS1894159_01950 [Bacteroidia bacterium]|nr:hypothetical protein FACS1894159_01950 [Bacteroidia bacterium]
MSMKNNTLELIILYALVTCVALIIATVARFFADSMGFDSFTSFMVFIIILVVEIIVYLSINVFVRAWMVPWIGKGLVKIPHFRKRIVPVADNTQIRTEHSLSKIQEWDNAKAIAIQYTKETFAPYLADDSEITRLCDYIILYAEKKDLSSLTPIKGVKQLSTTDILHFGWNIWNHFKGSKVGKQEDMALFLKVVFAHTLREIEVESIKSHLKDDERKGIIKIKGDISE